MCTLGYRTLCSTTTNIPSTMHCVYPMGYIYVQLYSSNLIRASMVYHRWIGWCQAHGGPMCLGHCGVENASVSVNVSVCVWAMSCILAVSLLWQPVLACPFAWGILHYSVEFDSQYMREACFIIHVFYNVPHVACLIWFGSAHLDWLACGPNLCVASI